MPRYLARRIAGNDRFAVLIHKMTPYEKFELVQMFFEADCTLIAADDIGDMKIQGSY